MLVLTLGPDIRCIGLHLRKSFLKNHVCLNSAFLLSPTPHLIISMQTQLQVNSSNISPVKNAFISDHCCIVIKQGVVSFTLLGIGFLFLFSYENFIQMNPSYCFLFVFFGQRARDRNLNGCSLFKIRRCYLFFPLNVIRSRQFSFDRGGSQHSCLIC